MAATVDLLDFLAPGVSDKAVADKQKALDLAMSHRPFCLSREEQDEAQVMYAAWLLSQLKQQAVAIIAPVGVVSEREGDLQRTFGAAAGTIDPMGFLARYNLLNDRCSKTIRVGGLQRGSVCYPGEHHANH